MTKRPLRGALRVLLFLVLTGFLLLLYLPAMALGKSPKLMVRRLWCRVGARIMGVRFRVTGRPFGDCPTLYVANHVSYLDILVLGTVLDGTFIAKAEIASWPLFGLLGRLTRTLFIRRHWRHALIQRNELAARMRQGESFILFGEGTSSDGLGVLPLKTSLLSVAEPWVLDCPVAVQPVTLVFARLADGTAIGRHNCDLYAWYGDEDFLPHLWRALQHEGLEIQVRLADPTLSWAVRSRKLLGKALHARLSGQLAHAMLVEEGGIERPVVERRIAGFS
ncbi:MAG: lysophospholipid acyltransferase family protein [Geminicoccaceae bacterium]